MRSIYLVYAVRMLIHPKTLKLVVLAALLWRSTSYVSYVDVFRNIPQVTDVGRDLEFAQSAIMGTEIATLFIVGAVFAFAVWLLRDMFHRTA